MIGPHTIQINHREDRCKGSKLAITSLSFLALLPILYTLEFLPNRSLRWQNFVLFAASYLFYATWDYHAVALLLSLSLINYSGAHWIFVAAVNRKPWIFRGVVAIDLFALAIFKILIPFDILHIPDNFIMATGLSFW